MVREPTSGSDVQLTLDRTLQHEVERIVADGTVAAGGRRGIAIIGRPATGEILAAGSVERDPETGAMRLSDAPIAVSNAYQAGSVFKLVTVAAAVEAGQVDAGHPDRGPLAPRRRRPDVLGPRGAPDRADDA